jgi:hypothetical protein
VGLEALHLINDDDGLVGYFAPVRPYRLLNLMTGEVNDGVLGKNRNYT